MVGPSTRTGVTTKPPEAAGPVPKGNATGHSAKAPVPGAGRAVPCPLWTWRTATHPGVGWPAPARTGRRPGGADRGQTAPMAVGGPPAMRGTGAPTVTVARPAPARCPGVPFVHAAALLSTCPLAGPTLTHGIKNTGQAEALHTAADQPAAPHPHLAYPSRRAWGQSLRAGRRSARRLQPAALQHLSRRIQRRLCNRQSHRQSQRKPCPLSHKDCPLMPRIQLQWRKPM